MLHKCLCYRKYNYQENCLWCLQHGADQDRTFIPDPVSFGGSNLINHFSLCDLALFLLLDFFLFYI